MKTFYVVSAEGLETFVAEEKKGIEIGLRNLYDAQIIDIKTDRNGDLKIQALDERGFLPEHTAEPHTEIYGEQKDESN